MSNANNGGPAFPSEQYGAWDDASKGMTLRDYFAAKAMQSYLMWPDADDWEISYHAKRAYAMADAMLKEREK